MSHQKPQQHDAPAITGLRQLPMQIAPERDLWPAIEARIAQQRARRRQRWRYAIAATALVSVAGVISVATRQQTRTDEAVAAPPAMRFAATRSLRQPENRALVRANLKMVANAQAQLRQALNTDSEKAYLQRLLYSAEQQQRELHRMLANPS